MLSIGHPDNGAQRLVGSSLKFIVDGVFVNGKMAVSSPFTLTLTHSEAQEALRLFF